MTNRTVVIRRNSCTWQPKIKTKTVVRRSYSAGFINPVFVVLGCVAFSGMMYLYSINHTAVKGLEIRQIEKTIAEKQKENENLKIKEAALKSLYRLEESSKQLNMSQIKDVSYIEEADTVALAAPLSAHK